MPAPLVVLGLLGLGALALAAGGKSEQPKAPAPPSGAPPGWPPGVPWPPTLPTMPGTPPASGPGPRTATGCELDATVPASYVPILNEALTRTDIPASALQGLAGLASSFGFPRTAACLSARAADLGHAQPPPAQGTTPTGWPQERPPWYPAQLPWPPPFPAPFPLPGAGATGPSGPAAPTGWGSRPDWLPEYFPWPPPFPYPAPGTPKPAGWPPVLPWPGDQPSAGPTGPNAPPPYTPGDIPPQGGAVPQDWGPRPATFPGTSIPYPPSLPWPPMAPLDPAQNPTVGSAVELQIRPGDTAAGFAAYYSGPGPGYDDAGQLGDVDLGPFAARLAEFASANPQLHPESNWSGFQVGAPFYVSAHLANVRGKPPLPTQLYQAFGGFVPRAGLTQQQILAGLGAVVGG